MNAQSHLAADVLDRLAINALSAQDKQQAESHLASCTRCADDLKSLQADMQHFSQFVMPRTQDQVRARVQRGASFWNPSRWMAPAFALAGAATLALIALPKQGVDTRLPVRYEGVKGGPVLSIYALAQGAQQPKELAQKAQVAPGDKLQFVVQPSGYEYLLIASVDGTGAVSAYYPPEGKKSAALVAGKQQLPVAIELDAAPGKEHVYAFFSHQPLELDSLSGALKANPEAPAAPANSSLQVFTFDKNTK
ncbi:MAG: DUF4384 domain-containing protein [Deltaproteobacteria bacterium]|nr:DUF4384 domain-containing protein [Deltaproteobacteria bacterium]